MIAPAKIYHFSDWTDQLQLSWKYMVSRERFLVTNNAFRYWLHQNDFGAHTIADVDHMYANDYLAKKGQNVCYLNPMEVLFLVCERKAMAVLNDRVSFQGFRVLTDAELASRLLSETNLEPQIYARYRMYRKFFVCAIFNTFAGSRFAIYQTTINASHSVALLFLEKDLLNIQAASRLVESVHKVAVLVGNETPPVNTKVKDWFKQGHTFHDVSCPFEPGKDTSAELLIRRDKNRANEVQV